MAKDLTLVPFREDRSLCWDATCVNTFGETVLINSATEPGSAVVAAEGAKKRKYRSLAERYIFNPLALEISGAFGPGAQSIVIQIGGRLKQKTGDQRETW